MEILLLYKIIIHTKFFCGLDLVLVGEVLLKSFAVLPSGD